MAESQQKANLSPNVHYKHYPAFKDMLLKQCSSTLSLIQMYGSESTKQAAIVQEVKQQAFHSITAQMISRQFSSTAFIFIATIVLHRKRSLVLTSTSTRSLFCKYMPTWLACALWPLYPFQKYNHPDSLTADFGQIQQDFYKIYTQYGQRFGLNRYD